MAKGRGAPTPLKKARIEIIPLIDIMFFLLASFMLVSMSMIKLQAIDTSVPAPSTAPPSQNPDIISIGIDKNGFYYFAKDKTPIPVTEIPARLSPLYKQQGDDLKVFINADQETSYASVIEALDQIRAMGLVKVSFPVKKDNHFDPNAPKRLVPVAAPATP